MESASISKYVAELIGTMVLTLVGCGVAVVVGCDTSGGVVATALAFGLSVVAMAYCIGRVSGCHINPAITVGMYLDKRMDARDAVGYIVFQFIGAIIGALLTGVFCAPSLGGAGFKGEWTSIGGQVYGQFMSIVITVIWSGIASFIAFKVAGLLTGGIRVSDETEREGLDIAVHGERGYNL